MHIWIFFKPSEVFSPSFVPFSQLHPTQPYTLTFSDCILLFYPFPTPFFPSLLDGCSHTHTNGSGDFTHPMLLLPPCPLPASLEPKQSLYLCWSCQTHCTDSEVVKVPTVILPIQSPMLPSVPVSLRIHCMPLPPGKSWSVLDLKKKANSRPRSEV